MSLLYVLIPVGTVAVIYLIRKFREYQWGWVRSIASLDDKIYIITGANTGLGYETTKALVKRNGTVIMACRNMDKANEAIANIRNSTGNGTMIPLKLDLASFDSIKEFTEEIKSKYSNFDCLILNAGLAVQTPQTTKENFEIHFGVNHLGHFYLTDLLKNAIKKNKCRIVVVSSLMHQRGKIDFSNLGKPVTEITRRMNHLYNNSKLANFYFARELYKQNYDAHVLCPGLCHTDFFRSYDPKWYHYVVFSPIMWWFLRSAEQGAQNIIHCATDNVNDDKKNPATGYVIVSLKQTKSKTIFDDSISEKLWLESKKMCNIE